MTQAKPRGPAAFVAVFCALFAIALIFPGCAPPPYQAELLPLEKAVRLMTNDLLHKMNAQRGVAGAMSEARVAIDTIIDAETGEATKTSERIQSLVAAQAKTFPKIQVFDLSSQNFKSAQYVMSGVIRLENYGGAVGNITHLQVSVADIASGRIVAHSDALIVDITQGFDPTQIYRDSPMYIKDRRVKALIDTAEGDVGGSADREYLNALEVSAMLNEAENAYNHGGYPQAADLFSKVAERPDGKVMRTYNGLYDSYIKLGQTSKAEEAFSSLLDLAIQNRVLTMKFLFVTDSTDFVKDASLRAEYALWLRQLAKSINTSELCVQILGHASKSGTKEYNDKLSLERAKAIQAQLGQQVKDKKGKHGAKAQTAAGGKTKAIGRGFADCKKCTGNEAFDTYDRRVEFQVVDCGGI